MQEDSHEMVGPDLSFKSNPHTTAVLKNQLHLIHSKFPLSELCKEIVAFIDINHADHTTFFACLSLLSTENFYNSESMDLLVDILVRFNTALKNILSAPSVFSRKLEREWLPQFEEMHIVLQPIRRRPRSLEAVPSYDPIRAPLTPRETLQSPTRRMDSPRTSSPVKEMLQMKRFWQHGDHADQEKDRHVANSSSSHAYSLDQ